MQSILNGIQTAAANDMLSARVPVECAGNRTEGSQDGENHKNLIFRETDAIGHPLRSSGGIVSGTGYLCESQTTAFLPYFQSALDAVARAVLSNASPNWSNNELVANNTGTTGLLNSAENFFEIQRRMPDNAVVVSENRLSRKG
jgi:hypothetical protein